ncbi:hypothetical protein ACWATR_37160 [Nostoc sp. UIC 10890]
MLNLLMTLTLATTQPNYDFYKTGGGMLAGALGASLILSSVGNSKADKLKTELERTSDQLKKAQETGRILSKKMSQAEKDRDIAKQLAIDLRDKHITESVRDGIANLDKNHELEKTIERLRAQLRTVSTSSTSSAHQIVEETYKKSIQKTQCLISGWISNYPDLTEFFENLESDLDKIKSWASKELEAYGTINTVDELINVGLGFQERIINKSADLRIKGYSTIIKYSQEQLDDAVPFSEYQVSIEDLSSKAAEEIRAKQLEVQHLAKSWVAANQGHIARYETEFTETLEQGKYLVDRNQELLAQIDQLKRPLTWSSATRQDLQIGNIIIAYFESKGIILDRAKADFDHWQSTLSFHCDRNGRTLTPGELEPEGERLQQLTHTLSPIKFSWDAEEGLMVAWLHLAKKPVKAIAETDINKIWKTADKFPEIVGKWSRVRITGGSESGKSPTAENLAVCILQARGGDVTLYNPQFNSRKNYWTLPTVGHTHEDSVQGIAELAQSVNGSNFEKFTLTLFDEIDSSMVSVEKKEQSVIGQNISTIIKQISHKGGGVIFVGQNANASKYPGMDRSDWNSAINVHIGSNAYDALTNTNQLTKPEQDRLKQQADKLTEYCDDKNRELGLEKTNPEAYRFALVIGDGKPYFIELPAFGKYPYSLISEALKCPNCESLNHISNGSGKRKCKDCNHVFKA